MGDEIDAAVGRGTSRGRPPAVSPDQVLDAAEGLVGEGGFEGLSVRRIAEAVGVSRQVVYTHFGGMDGLLDGLHRRLSSRLTESGATLAETPGTSEHVLEVAAAYRSVARRWPALYQLVFERPVPDHVAGVEAEAEARESFAHVVAAAAAWLDRQRSDGASPSVSRASEAEAVELARSLWSVTHGFVVLERAGFADVATTDALSDRALAALLAGWTSTGR